MANYIVEMDGTVHADSTAAVSAITSAGASVSTTFDLNLTYEIDCTSDQLAAITGVKYSSLSEADSGLEASALDQTHFNYIDNRWHSQSNQVTAGSFVVGTEYIIVEAGNTDFTLIGSADSDLKTTFTATGVGTGTGIVSPSVQSAFISKYTGDGKTVYLLDSGMNQNHEEFANATITNLWTAFDTNPNGDAYDSDYEDNVGHGTAVGSLIVGENIGTAKDCTLMNVKLYDQAAGNTSVVNVITAFNKVLVHHNANDNTDVKVLCAPWVTTQNDLIDSKVMELNSANVVVVAAAGNNNDDVNTYSPAGIEEIITVGSIDRNYAITAFTNTPWSGGSANVSFPNYGSSLDILTIGEDVCMAASLSNTLYTLGSGTSLSTGLVAGGTAAFVEKHPTFNSNKIKETLIAEGRVKALLRLDMTDEALAAHPYFSNVNFQHSFLQLDSAGDDASVELFTTPSGVVGTIQKGQSATIDLGLNAGATDIEVLSFSPLSPWMAFDTATGILTADTTSVAANMSPAYYTFGIKGKLGNIYSVEEYTVGVYTTAESELQGNINSYYYDADNSEYDINSVIAYELSPQFSTQYIPGGKL
jgi:hypothetical protein|tara:strand:- start:1122 stop:2885 length:1764 start_codon:yes stop_codon:yes gene_type:complete